MSDDGTNTDNSKLFDSNPDEEDMDTGENNLASHTAQAMQAFNEHSEPDITDYTVIERHEVEPEDTPKEASDGKFALSPSNASLNDSKEQKKKQTQNNRLKEQNKKFKEEINRLEGANTKCEETIKQFQAEIESMKSTQAQLEETNLRFAEENIRIQQEANDNITTCRAQNDRLADENNRLRDLLNQAESKNKSIPILEKEIDDLKKKALLEEKSKADMNIQWNVIVSKTKTENDKQLKKLEKDILDLRKENEKQVKKLEKDIIELKKEKEKQVKKLETDIIQIKKEKAALQQKVDLQDKTIKAKEKENENFVASANIMKEQYEARERAVNQTIKNLSDGKGQAEHLVTEKQRRIENLQTTLQDHVSTINNHVSTIHSLEKDKKDLTLRLSKLAGANLTYNNPNIADLSDENRPTKLAEEFSELYDNEWTDAFEKIDMSDEREKTQFMLSLLKQASDLCHDTSKRHMTAIKQSFSTLSIEELKVENVPAMESVEDSTTTKIQEREVTEKDKKEQELANGNVNQLPYVNDTEKRQSQEGDTEKEEATGEKNEVKEPTLTHDNGNPLTSVNGRELPKNEERNTGINEGEATGENKNDNDNQSTSTNGTEMRQNEKSDTGITGDDADTDGNIITNDFDNGLPEHSDDENLENNCEHKDDANIRGNFMGNKIESDPPKSPDHEKQLLEKSECDNGERKKPCEPSVQTEPISEAPSKEPCEASVQTEPISEAPSKEPCEASVQTESISEAPSKQAQTTYVEISVDFEKQLANEQKKTILDIRKMFENHLSKEFQEVAKGIIVKQLPADQQNEESIIAYIEECVAICWSMCRHEPPVHIHFPETEGDTKYDTNMFKPYTKTGKLLDFIVWPALYLHEGGPMLAKGVAQGRNSNSC